MTAFCGSGSARTPSTTDSSTERREMQADSNPDVGGTLALLLEPHLDLLQQIDQTGPRDVQDISRLLRVSVPRPFAFLEAFGNKPTTVKKLPQGA